GPRAGYPWQRCCRVPRRARYRAPAPRSDRRSRRRPGRRPLGRPGDWRCRRLSRLDERKGPLLSPAELAARCDHVLATAVRPIRQMPDHRLESQSPNRPRSWRVPMHHVFQIAVAYLDLEERGLTLSYERLTLPPPPEMRSSAAIADFGESAR